MKDKGHRVSNGTEPFGLELDQIRSYVEELAGFGHRGSATPNEAQAAEWVVSQLAESGIPAVIQPFKGRKTWAVSYVVHVCLAAAGACLLYTLPWVSAGIAVAVLISLIGEHTTRWPSLRQLFGSSPSRNVFAKHRGEGELKRRFLLVAHLDTQRTGLIWNEASQPFLFTATWLPIWARNAFFPVTLTLALQAAAGAFFGLQGFSHLATVAGWLLLAVYLVTLLLVIDWWQSPYVPGALDNASGVAAVLTLASRFQRRPIPSVELWLLFTGCEESGLLGATAWAKQHGAEKENLQFINMDCVGVGPIRYFDQESPILGPAVAYPRDLLLQAGRVASTFSTAPAPISLPGPTDGLPLLVRGFRGITVLGLTADGRMPNYHRMTDIAEHVDYESIGEAVDFAWALMADNGL